MTTVKVTFYKKHPVLKIQYAEKTVLSLGLFKAQKIVEKFDDIVEFVRRLDNSKRFVVFNEKYGQFILDIPTAFFIYRHIFDIWTFVYTYDFIFRKLSPKLEEWVGSLILIDLLYSPIEKFKKKGGE